MNNQVTKILSILLTVLVLSVSFQGCKKGEEDPFISLKSRKKRLTGKWEAKELIITEPGESPVDYINGKYEFNGTTYTITGEFIMNFEKDEDMKMDYTGTESDGIDKVSIAQSTSGEWSFEDKKATLKCDFKDDNLFSSDLEFDLTRLTSKELKMEAKDKDGYKYEIEAKKK